MNAEAFISASIARGDREGLSALVGKERTVYLILQVSVICDLEGIDTILDLIEAKQMSGVSDAFAAVGAVEIAQCMRTIEEALPERHEAALDHADRLIASRVGYSDDTIKGYVEEA